MNGQPILTDALIERMLVQRVGVAAPRGLIDAIAEAVAETTQVRRWWWERVPVPAPRSPTLRLALIVALVGLLLATAVGASLVGSGLLRQHEPPSVVVPGPSQAPFTEPTFGVTASAFGAISWSTISVLGDGLWWPLAGTPHGPLAVVEREVGEGHVDDLRWLGPDGSWPRLTPASHVFRLLPLGDGVIVSPAEDAPPYWLRWSRSAWELGEPVDLDGAMDVNDLATGPLGTLLTDGTAIQVSTDGRTFVRAAEPPTRTKLEPNGTRCEFLGAASWGGGEGHIGPMIVTDRGFVALTAADPGDWATDPICEPVVWFSNDGSSWDLVSASSPFGRGAYVREVAGRAGRHVAVGGVSPSASDVGNAVWSSEDGLDWERITMPEPAGPCPLEEPLVCGHVYSRVVAGAAGWIVLDNEGFAWTSADGRHWEAAEGWPVIPAGWLEQGLALSPGSVVETSVGEIGVIGTFESR